MTKLTDTNITLTKDRRDKLKVASKTLKSDYNKTIDYLCDLLAEDNPEFKRKLALIEVISLKNEYNRKVEEKRLSGR